jgi:hypothetical protein
LGLGVSGDGSEFGSGDSSGERKVSFNLGGGLADFGGGVVDITLLRLAFLSGEDDELVLVSGKSFDVALELLGGGVGASVVNSNSNGLGPFLGHLGTSEFSESETSSVSGLTSISAGSGGDDGSELLKRSGEGCLSLGLSLMKSSLLFLGLVKVSVDSLLPVFTEMDVGNDVVVLNHWLLYIQ